MNRDARLSELLMEWEERKSQGRPVSTSELCRDDPELIPELERQIRALSRMDALLGDAQIGDSHHDLHAAETLAAKPELENDSRPVDGRTMSTHSNYRIMRSHARGGLGEVLVAYDERLGRQVALKIIRQPYDRDPARRNRFVREAEITSRLEHPGIVPVHGIGQDAEGRLCYTMKLIGGESLHDAIKKFYSDDELNREERERNLAFRQLLGRFVSVCNTIAYAHSQRIIHRDVKPANIMLGAFGETLVVDWGLAKQLAPAGDSVETSSRDSASRADMETTLDADVASSEVSVHGMTREGHALGTPAFMSPEQSRGDIDQIGPASDIYSLGATVYMLLTGRPPFDGRSIQELVRSIQQGDFPLPHRVRASVAKPLESVCIKAMALRPKDRYATALELAAEIEKWLADEPVSAHQESLVVRGRRWMRRHRLVVASSSAALVVALVGLIVVVVLMTGANERLRIANQQESNAKAAAVESAAVAMKNAELAEQQSELALRSLQSVTFDIQRKLKNVPAAHKVRRRLLDTALQGLAEVAASLDKRPQVNQSLMIAHRDLGDVFFQAGSEGGIGGTESARTQYQRALDIAQTLADAAPADMEAQRQLANCLDKLADVCDRTGATQSAQEHYERAMSIRQKLMAEHPGDEQVLRDVSVSLNRIGDLLLKGGAVAEARDRFRRALEIRQQQATRNVTDEYLQRDLAIGYNKVGHATLRLGDAKQAMELHKLGLEVNQKRVEASPDDDEAQRDLTVSYERLGNASWALGNFKESADLYDESLKINERRVTQDPENAQAQRDLMQALEKSADALTKLGKNDAALSLAKRMTTICEQLVAADPNDSRALRDLAMAYSGLGDRVAATPDVEAALEWHQKSLTIRKQRAKADPSDPRGPTDIAFGLTKLGDGLLAAKNVEDALKNYGEALKIHQQRCEANPSDRMAQSNLAAYHQRIGVACRQAGRFDQASESYQQALQIAEKLSAADPYDIPIQIMIITFCHSLGFLEQNRKEFAKAHKWYEQGLELAKKLEAAGKLVGDDATWDTYIEDAIRECRAEEAEKENSAN